MAKWKITFTNHNEEEVEAVKFFMTTVGDQSWINFQSREHIVLVVRANDVRRLEIVGAGAANGPTSVTAEGLR